MAKVISDMKSEAIAIRSHDKIEKEILALEKEPTAAISEIQSIRDDKFEKFYNQLLGCATMYDVEKLLHGKNNNEKIDNFEQLKLVLQFIINLEKKYYFLEFFNESINKHIIEYHQLSALLTNINDRALIIAYVNFPLIIDSFDKLYECNKLIGNAKLINALPKDQIARLFQDNKDQDILSRIRKIYDISHDHDYLHVVINSLSDEDLRRNFDTADKIANLLHFKIAKRVVSSPRHGLNGLPRMHLEYEYHDFFIVYAVV